MTADSVTHDRLCVSAMEIASPLQPTATHRNPVQPTATHYNHHYTLFEKSYNNELNFSAKLINNCLFFSKYLQFGSITFTNAMKWLCRSVDALSFAFGRTL